MSYVPVHGGGSATPPAFAPALASASPDAGGGLVIRSAHALGPYPRHMSERLRAAAEASPDRRLFAERRQDGGLREVTYGEARRAVDALATALLDRGLGPEAPLMILSENAIDHALLALAAMQIGAPVAPVSPAYSLLSKDLDKLQSIHALLAPGLVYASDAGRYARAIDALGAPDDRVVTSHGGRGTALAELLSTAPSAAMEEAYRALGPDAVAKILFTSGSTGAPKGVLNTQRMMCSNQQAITEVWPFLREKPPVLVDWLPWSHTFGGNHNLNMALYHGGSILIDEGKPTPDLIGRTAENLRAVSPTIYFNVPRGFEALLPLLERDEALRAAFFRDLDAVFYAAASLPAALWERLVAVSIAAKGSSVTMLSAWGLTETAPMATTVHFPIARAGVIGLPAPGTAIRLVPSPAYGEEVKYEARVKGPNVTPGYLKRPDWTAAAFDEEGYFKTGDAVKLVDPQDPSKGIAFDGRIAEDFKLVSGTWVHVGALRPAVVAAASPLVADAVVAGLDRAEIGLLIVPGALASGLDRASLADQIAGKLRAYNAEHAESSRRIGRFLILDEPLTIDAGEITDKGYINQRAVLERRAALVERLYAGGEGVTVMRY